MGDFSMDEVQAIMVSLNGVLQEILRPQGFAELGDVDPTKNSVSFDARRDNGILVTWRLVLPKESRSRFQSHSFVSDGDIGEPVCKVCGSSDQYGHLAALPKEQSG